MYRNFVSQHGFLFHKEPRITITIGDKWKERLFRSFLFLYKKLICKNRNNGRFFHTYSMIYSNFLRKGVVHFVLYGNDFFWSDV